ncbi:hypothetical protein EW146_g4944 [Bondarzewia mesenterica]|uniref:Uncharacterized protein n=1 Tax=Bondarzewia mesenterica TaxID=1095465 RepID=A0A4S4LYQ9_9AGAM|nr:hypothetical protein EW146_g4944 [Bondarzewia mesenterica]
MGVWRIKSGGHQSEDDKGGGQDSGKASLSGKENGLDERDEGQLRVEVTVVEGAMWPASVVSTSEPKKDIIVPISDHPSTVANGPMVMDKDESILSDHPSNKWPHQDTEDINTDNANDADANTAEPVPHKRQKKAKVINSPIMEVQEEPSKGQAVKKAKKLPQSNDGPKADSPSVKARKIKPKVNAVSLAWSSSQ